MALFYGIPGGASPAGQDRGSSPTPAMRQAPSFQRRRARPRPHIQAGGQGSRSWSAKLSAVHRHVLLWICRADVVGARTDQPIVVELFDDVGGPPAHAGNRKDWREQVDVDTQRVIGRGRREVHVGVKLLIGFNELFDGARGLKPLRLSARSSQIT